MDDATNKSVTKKEHFGKIHVGEKRKYEQRTDSIRAFNANQEDNQEEMLEHHYSNNSKFPKVNLTNGHKEIEANPVELNGGHSRKDESNS